MRTLKALVCAAAMGFCGAAAAGQSYSSVIAFGDSLSDNGNYYRLIDSLTPLDPGDGSPPLPYFFGRFSNGPVMVERLAQNLRVPLRDFAYGGAKTGPDLTPAASGGPFDNGDPRANGTGLLAQVNRFVRSQRRLDDDALYIVWAGPNDFFDIALNDPAAVAATLDNAIRHLSTAVTTLIRHGARHILVPGMPDLGLTPLLSSQSAGPQGSALSAAFNSALDLALLRIGNAARGVDLKSFDIAALQHEIVADPAAFGLADVQDECILDRTSRCILDSFDAGGAAGYFFWDDVHPTAALHSIFAGRIQALVAPAPAASAPAAAQAASADRNWLDIARERQH